MLERSTSGRWALPWRHAHLALTVLVVLLWSQLGERLAGLLFVPAWVLVTQLIAAGSLEAARLRRRAWLDQYLRDDSPWHRWLRGGALMVARHQLLGACLALLLLVKLRLLAWVDWPMLLVAVVGLVGLRNGLRRRLARHVIRGHLPAVTRRLVVPPAAGLLSLMLVAVALWLPQPYLVGLGWEEALLRHLQGRDAASLLGFFERLGSAAEIIQYWAMQNAVESQQLGAPLALLGWSLLLLTQSAFAWAYVRLLVGADALRREGGRSAPVASRLRGEEETR
ncbi:hypothetical protein [Halomonas heilongjiangensis]|uniref:Uncharacterized protein n=1 Tax=Halomonas heilongjiangensis TaxID=1387883 RepID=A0A2N7THP5_9GAMM|nr:hypothetical protein [Halomonas heilongjiangensis]PMR67711.1 hypothetical protein C1H66_18365 [Halomonas heilongjiangensis]PXX87586.1 hypothetical protein CR158_17410 [Halomonas heilongjiangensis]